jgi:prepilin-type N-terminal cleavage/methylation domain-containing protein
MPRNPGTPRLPLVHPPRRGFTLIELLIAIVIIGILVTIAVPRFRNTKEKAYVAAMKSDLHSLFIAEESYFSDNLTYTTDKDALKYQESAGVTVDIRFNRGRGFRATATHSATTRTCQMYLGFAQGNGNTDDEGIPDCG